MSLGCDLVHDSGAVHGSGAVARGLAYQQTRFHAIAAETSHNSGTQTSGNSRAEASHASTGHARFLNGRSSPAHGRGVQADRRGEQKDPGAVRWTPEEIRGAHQRVEVDSGRSARSRL